MTLTLNRPVAAPPLAENVTWLVLDVGLVPNVAVTPLGKPDAVKFTLLLNPFAGLMLTVVKPDPP